MCNAWCLEFAEIVPPILGNEFPSILEVGSRDINGSVREVLSECAGEYIGVDMCEGPGVDRVLNVAALADTFKSESFDLVVSTEMLEHCEKWQDALYQMASVLRDGGLLLITTRSPGFELHDYPSDYWRFSYDDFERIFSRLGSILALQSDMTLGWPCGIGVLVRKKIGQTDLVAWKAWLDSVQVYTMVNEEKHPLGHKKGSSPEAMIFDQYSRYKACSDLLHRTDFIAGNSVLDVGSGPECLFGQFMPDALMTYVDPLIPRDSGHEYISGNIFSSDLAGRSFDCVSAVDVLEHIPPEERREFLERLSSLGKRTLILGFPASDSLDASETDRAINDQYRTIFGRDFSWLEEHSLYGLPSLAETIEQLRQMGWHCQTIGHGHTPWLQELLGFVVCVLDIPSMSNLLLAISEKFNRELYPYDFRPPHYRQFVIATHHPLPPISIPVTNSGNAEIATVFRSLMEEANRQYFAASLQQLAERDAYIADLNQKVTEVSGWVRSVDATVAERDAYIADLNQKVGEVSGWAQSLQATVGERDAQAMTLHQKIVSLERALSDKHAELMRMSDWAYSMTKGMGQLRTSFRTKLVSAIIKGKSLARKKLARSYLGDVARYVRTARKSRANVVPLAALRKSLEDSNGRLLITFPIIIWDFRWQRPQHIVTRLRDQGFAVVYLAMSITPLSRRFHGLKEAGATLQFNELAKNIYQVWLHSNHELNIYTDPVEGDDLYNLTLGLDALVRELKPKSIHYLLQFPGWWPIAKELKQRLGGMVVFDCMDDHGGFSTNSIQALKVEHELVEHADLVITSSAVLENRCRAINPKTIQVKNGTEFDHFQNPQKNGLLDHLADCPIIGYYGAISDWFDMGLVAHCAQQRPDWNFVLIGSTFGADLAPVSGLANVHFLGEKPYKDLPGYLAYFDVCTIPFKIITLTLATNPVKFYEYLSAGKPVVSVRLPELLPYADNCYLASNSSEFLNHIVTALSERNDPRKIERRRNLARENSWDNRAKKILISIG